MRNIRYVFLVLTFAAGCAVGKAQQLYFPPLNTAEWEMTSPESLGWCTNGIDTLYSFLESNNTKAFLVLKDGRLVMEKYFGNCNADSIRYWASAGKTLTSLLTGIAQEEGFLSIDSSAGKYLGNGWTSCPAEKERLITVKSQLTMTSGLDDQLNGPDCTTPACLQYLSDAGTRWAYHNAPYTLLDQVIGSATGMDFNSYFNSRIRNKIGMNGFWFNIDYNHIYFSTARSMARFGLLLLAKGQWGGIAVIRDSAYFEAMTQPSQTLNKSYGYLAWLNGKASYMLPQTQFIFPGSLCPDAPADMFSAIGKNGQLINVVPSLGLVVIRMGNAPGDQYEIPTVFNNLIWKHLNEIICNTHGISAEEAVSKAFKVFPNPAGKELFIVPANPLMAYKVILYDIHGQVVAQSQNTEKMDISGVSPGTYFVEILQQNTRQQFTISILH